MKKATFQLILLLIAAAHSLSAAGPRPNILLIVADDLRADAIASLGNGDVITPNLDKLVKKGTAFTQAYNMGGRDGDVSASSRAMMMSGRSLFRFSGPVTELEDDMPLLPEVLRNAGYATFLSGKWVNGTGWFQRSFTHGDQILFEEQKGHEGFRVYTYNAAGDYPPKAGKPVRGFSSEAFANAAIEFLNARPRGKPFFACVSFAAPQAPWTPPESARSLYKNRKISLPKNYRPEHDFDNGSMNTPDEQLALKPRAPNEIREHLVNYYALVTHMDQQIGRIMDALDATGVLDNTLIVFVSDSGMAMGSHGLMGKQNLYEPSIRVPLIFSGLDVPHAKQHIALCYLLDVYPTIGELTGVKTPASLEGKSLVPVIHYQAGDIRKAIFAAYDDQQRMVRDYRWKLIWYPPANRYQLFDLRTDEAEQNDLFNSGNQGPEINRLRIQMQALQTSLKDPVR